MDFFNSSNRGKNFLTYVLSYFYESSVFASNWYVLPVVPDNRNNSRNTLNRNQSQKCLMDDLFQNGFHSTAFKTRISSKIPDPSLYYYIQTYLEGEYGGGGWVCRVLTGNPGMTIGSWPSCCWLGELGWECFRESSLRL